MKIETRLKLINFALLAFVILIGISLFFSIRELNNTFSKRKEIDKLIQGIFELKTLTNEYLMSAESKPEAPWEIKYNKIQDDIATIDVASDNEKQYYDSITKGHIEIYLIFHKMITLSLDYNKKGISFDDFVNIRDNLHTNLFARFDNIINDSKELVALKEQTVILSQKHTIWFVMAYVFLIAGSFYIITLLMIHGVLRPLNNLQNATNIIASGNLDYKVDAKRKDEIGELSSSFNIMIEKLKNVTTSRDELNKEIVERKKVEEELIIADNVQSVMIKIANAANSTTGLSELFSLIHEYLGELIDTTNFYIALLDKNKQVFSFPYLVDKYESSSDVPYGRGVTSYVFKTGRPLFLDLVNERSECEELDIDLKGFQAKYWLGVPLKVEHEIIGVIAVQTYDEEVFYTRDDLEILNFISDQIANAIKYKEAELKVRASMKLASAVLQNSPVAISSRDRNGNLLSANTAWKKLWNIKDEDYLKFKEADEGNKTIIKTPFLGNYKKKIDRIYEKGGVLYINEFLANNYNSSKYLEEPKWISLYFYGVMNDNNEVDQVVTFIEDITSRKLSEERRKEKELVEKIKLAVGGVAHELNNPLSEIFLFSQVGKKKTEAESAEVEKLRNELNKYYTQIFKAADRMKTIITQMQDLSRVKTKEYVQGAAIIDFSKSSYQNLAKDKKDEPDS